MKFVTTIIIGAGQAGLAMSKHLTDRSIDHVLLERGKIANSWKTERWDSLQLLTPNWQSRLPDYRYTGNDPDGFMNMKQVVSFLDGFASKITAPVHENTTVQSVERRFNRYIVKTSRGSWSCSTLVLANGACSVPSIPKAAEAIPSSVRQMSPLEYKNPEQLDPGGVLVVGGSATGVQLAAEIHRSGRPVTLSTGEHIRVPRTYRNRDIKWWMDSLGLMDLLYTEMEDLTRARKLPSLQLVGSDDRIMLDLNCLQQMGVEMAGRLAGFNNGKVQFSGSLANMCALADLKMGRLLDSIDEWIEENGDPEPDFKSHRFEPTAVRESPPLLLDLSGGQIKTIIWATGYRADYSWLDVPVLDRKGNIKHAGGVVDAPGMYAMGLPFLRTRKSTLIDGVDDDARFLANHLHQSLDQAVA